jgi:hypothetical protein
VGDQIGTGATANVFTGKFRGNQIAYKEFHEGSDLREFRREISMIR